MLPRWPRRVAVPLAVSASLVLTGLVVRLAHPDAPPPGRGVSAPLVLRVLDVNRERNVPTAWSVALLLGCAWAAVRLARAGDRGRVRGRGWELLSALLLAMAADEALHVHERADALGRILAGDALHFAWVVPGALVSGVAALVLLRSLAGAPVLVRRRICVAAGLYLSGALGVEALSGLVLDEVGRGSAYALLNALEEGLEMVGACLLLGALLLARDPRAPVAPVDREGPTSLAR